MNKLAIDLCTLYFLRYGDWSWVLKAQPRGSELPPGWVFGVQLMLRQTQALIKSKEDEKNLDYRVALDSLLQPGSPSILLGL